MWYAEFDQMSNIHAFETATHCDSDCRFWQGSSFAEPDEQLYMCGDHLTYPSADPQASVRGVQLHPARLGVRACARTLTPFRHALHDSQIAAKEGQQCVV